MVPWRELNAVDAENLRKVPEGLTPSEPGTGAGKKVWVWFFFWGQVSTFFLFFPLYQEKWEEKDDFGQDLEIYTMVKDGLKMGKHVEKLGLTALWPSLTSKNTDSTWFQPKGWWCNATPNWIWAFREHADLTWTKPNRDSTNQHLHHLLCRHRLGQTNMQMKNSHPTNTRDSEWTKQLEKQDQDKHRKELATEACFSCLELTAQTGYCGVSWQLKDLTHGYHVFIYIYMATHTHTYIYTYTLGIYGYIVVYYIIIYI